MHRENFLKLQQQFRVVVTMELIPIYTQEKHETFSERSVHV